MYETAGNRILIRRLAAAATGVLLVTGVFACGSSGSDSASDTTTTSSAGKTTTTAASGEVALSGSLGAPMPQTIGPVSGATRQVDR